MVSIYKPGGGEGGGGGQREVMCGKVNVSGLNVACAGGKILGEGESLANEQRSREENGEKAGKTMRF